MDWPSCSPDLIVVENLWTRLVRKAYKNGMQYSTKDELWDRVCSAWEKTGLASEIACFFHVKPSNGSYFQARRKYDVLT